MPFFGFWIFWVLGSGNYFEFPRTPFFWRANFPEPSRISQNPKKARVSAQAQNTTRLRHVVSFTHTACLRKCRTHCVVHAYSVSAQAQSTTRLCCVLCRSRIRRSTRLLVLCCSCYADRVVDVGVDGPRLARSNFELKIINLFDSSSFVYFKKPCSTGFWEILFFSRTQNPKNPEPKR